MDVIVHDDAGEQVKPDEVKETDCLENRVTLTRAESQLAAVQAPRDRVRSSLESPVRQATAVDAQGHRAKVAFREGPADTGFGDAMADLAQCVEGAGEPY